MITETLIRKMEAKTATYRTSTLARLCKGLSTTNFHAFIRGFEIGCNGIEMMYQEMCKDQLELEERRRLRMVKKKGMTKNQKLKLNKTASAKKKVKATKK